MLTAWLVAGCAGPATVSRAPVMGLAMVNGDSMLPAIRNGAVVPYIANYPYAMLRPGQVASYRSRMGVVVIHRLVAKRAGGWVMKGDNNRYYDREWLTRDNIVGVAILTNEDWQAARPLVSHDTVTTDIR